MRRTVRNELAKMRHRGLGGIAGASVVFVVALSLFGSASDPAFGDAQRRSWLTLLSSISLAVSAVSPLLLAILASRHVDFEHVGGGWLAAAGAGLPPGRLCRAKLVALGVVVGLATAAQLGILFGVGWLLIPRPVPVGAWLAYAGSVLLVNLVLLGLHTLVSARIENQLVGLGVGVIGTVLAMFASGLPAWLAGLTPWGWYALVAAADFRGDGVVAMGPNPSVLLLAALAAGVLWLITHRLDRQEV